MTTSRYYQGTSTTAVTAGWRSRLSVALRAISALFVFAVYLAAMTVSYRSAARLDFTLAPTLKWLYPAVVIGLVVVGSLGVGADTIDAKNSPYPWLLIVLGTAVQVVFGLIETHGWAVRSTMEIALPPITTALAMAELSREVRNLLGGALGRP
jgi:hypothetical protein